jgi:hypothetical protein
VYDLAAEDGHRHSQIADSRRLGREQVAVDDGDIGELALIATLRDLSIAELVGQALAGAIKKDMIEKILRGDVPSSSV